MSYKVVTPWAIIMSELLDQIKIRYTNANFRFEPSMEYVDAIKGLRAVRNSKDIDDIGVFPLFVFNRGNILPHEFIGRRFSPLNRTDNNANEMKSRMCQVEVMFRVYSRDTVFADTFEVMYNNRESVNEILTISVDLPELGEFPFYIEWNDLSGITFNKTDNFYIGIDFGAKICGNFMLMENASVSIIEHINLKIMDYERTVFTERHI